MSQPTTDLAGKIEKMARLAFDPAAAEGESVAAVTKLVQIARKNSIDFNSFKILLGVTTSAPKSKLSYSADVMPFGKYEGLTFEEIFLSNPDYLDWISKKVTWNKKLTDCIHAFLKAKQNLG